MALLCYCCLISPMQRYYYQAEMLDYYLVYFFCNANFYCFPISILLPFCLSYHQKCIPNKHGSSRTHFFENQNNLTGRNKSTPNNKLLQDQQKYISLLFILPFSFLPILHLSVHVYHFCLTVLSLLPCSVFTFTKYYGSENHVVTGGNILPLLFLSSKAGRWQTLAITKGFPSNKW